MNRKVAVVMSFYSNDKVGFLKESVRSIFEQQNVDVHLYIVQDGPCSKDLISSIELDSNITMMANLRNEGLAFCLNRAIDRVISDDDCDYIARMDADDISVSNRFSEQVNFLDNNNDIDVVGSDVWEIDNNGAKKFYKKMDSSHQELLKNIIVKCPFNHPTVMFRKSVFKEGLRYKASLKNTQDYYLWVDLLSAGKKIANINEPLVLFRVDENFHKRRGLKKAINDLNSRLYAFKYLDCFCFRNVFHTFMLVVLRLLPSFLKKIAYKYFR